MSTARDLIKGSLRLIGVLASGETPSADEQNDAVSALNQMLDSWSLERLTVCERVREEFSLVSAQDSYTMGDDVSADFETDRPLRIEAAGIIINQSEYPIDVISEDEYADIVQKDLQSELPQKLFQQGSSPLETLKIWPVPSTTVTIALYSWKPLSRISSVSTDLEFPPGYERALRYNLALELAPEYGKEPSMTLLSRAIEAKTNIKIKNIKPVYTTSDPFACPKPYNIYTGE